MNDMDYRDYRDYRNYRDDEEDRDYRDYRNYREDYRRRDYDRRGGRRNYRNYRDQGYTEELEMATEDLREHYRTLEDISEMASNQQEKNMLMKVAQTEKEHYKAMKEMLGNHM